MDGSTDLRHTHTGRAWDSRRGSCASSNLDCLVVPRIWHPFRRRAGGTPGPRRATREACPSRRRTSRPCRHCHQSRPPSSRGVRLGIFPLVTEVFLCLGSDMHRKYFVCSEYDTNNKEKTHASRPSECEWRHRRGRDPWWSGRSNPCRGRQPSHPPECQEE